jgi:hypothetical protein
MLKFFVGFGVNSYFFAVIHVIGLNILNGKRLCQSSMAS